MHPQLRRIIRDVRNGEHSRAALPIGPHLIQRSKTYRLAGFDRSDFARFAGFVETAFAGCDGSLASAEPA
jgi:hypothetical protein